MKDNIVSKINDLIAEKIKVYNDQKYIYDNRFIFDKVEGKTPFESFMEKEPLILADCFDEIFDEIHPY